MKRGKRPKEPPAASPAADTTSMVDQPTSLLAGPGPSSYDRRGRPRRAADVAPQPSPLLLEPERAVRAAAEATRQRVSAQYSTSETLRAARDFAEALPQLLESLAVILDWTVAACWCHDANDGVLLRTGIWSTPETPADHLGLDGATRRFRRGEGLPGRVWQAAAPAWVEDIEADPDFPRRDPARADGLRSALAFPIRSGGTVFGVMELLDHRPRVPDETLLQSVTAIGNQIGQFLERKRAERALRRQLDAQRVLADVSHRLIDALDANDVAGAVADLLVPSVADLCAVYVLAADGALHLARLAVADPRLADSIRDLAQRAATTADPFPGVLAVARERVARLGAALAAEVPDEGAPAAGDGAAIPARYRELGLRSSVAAPLVARGRTLGVLALAASAARRPYDAADVALVEELARRAALALENARSHEEIRLARLDAEQANRAKTEFLTAMSHELRTPLNAIAGYAQLLELGVHGPMSAEQMQAVRRIGRSQRHLLALINDVLNYARIEARRLEPELRPVSTTELLGEVELLVTPQVQARGLSFEREPCASPSGCVIIADAEMVRQILLNLLSNAIKFTERGGRIRLWCDLDDEHVRVHVRDTGIGIPTSKLASIFDPFVQVDRSLASGHEGTGLGLAISRELARVMGGDLVAASVMGQGSQFTLTLSRSAPAAPATSTSSAHF